jgi:hypothetical protein
MKRQQKITFGETRAFGVHDALVYCRDHRCSQQIEISADRWPDDRAGMPPSRERLPADTRLLVQPAAADLI